MVMDGIIIVHQSHQRIHKNEDAVALDSDGCSGGASRSDPGPDLVGAAARTGFCVRRKKRNMARQRRPAIKFLSFTSTSSSSSSSRVPPQPTFPAPARGLDPRRLRFLFEKELKNSDVGSLRRMILPKKAAEAHLLVLESKEGIPISNARHRQSPCLELQVQVLAEQQQLNVRAREHRYPVGNFVNTHGLQLGDFIVVYRDDENRNYAIQARKASDEEDVYIDIDIPKSNIDDILIRDNHDRDDNKGRISGYEYYCPIFDDDGMSFIYDTTLSSDSPLDFLGGSMSMTSFPRTRQPESFGSVENMSLDDFY